MKARFVLPVLALLVSACQTANPFFSKGAEEPPWFKAKAAEAANKDYPASSAIPPNPHDVPLPAIRQKELASVEKAGRKISQDTRSSPGQPKQPGLDAFARKGHEATEAPPLVDEMSRPH